MFFANMGGGGGQNYFQILGGLPDDGNIFLRIAVSVSGYKVFSNDFSESHLRSEKNSLNIKFLGGIFLGHPGPRRRDIPDKNLMQVAFFCCFRQGVAGMSRDLGRDVPDLGKLYGRKLWADFSYPITVCVSQIRITSLFSVTVKCLSGIFYLSYYYCFGKMISELNRKPFRQQWSYLDDPNLLKFRSLDSSMFPKR